MDDLIFKFGSKRFNYNADFLKLEYESGGFKILYPFQIWLQGIPLREFENELVYYIFNLIILFLILYLGSAVLNKYISIDKNIFYLVIFTFPYFTDFVLHPSLQEKYIFLVFFLLLYLFQDNDKNYSKYLIISLSFLLPFVKIQAAPLLIVFFILCLKNNFDTNSLYYFFPMLFACFIVFVAFLNGSGYHSNKIKQGFSIENYISNFFSTQSIFILFVTFLIIFLNFEYKKNDFLYSILLYNILLLVLLAFVNNFSNYLYSIYSIPLGIVVAGIFDIFSKNIRQIARTILITVCIFSNVLFFLPKLERWYDLGQLIENLSNNMYNEDILYTCEEGTEVLNQIQNNKILFFSEEELNSSFDKINKQNFIFISDTFSCNNIESYLIENCLEDFEFNDFYTEYERIYLKKFLNCNSVN